MTTATATKNDQNLKALKALNWEVATLPLYNPITNGPTNFYGTFRKDTGEPFAMGLTGSYKVVQNSEMVGIGKDYLAEFGEEMKVKSVWSFHGGANNTIQLTTNPIIVGGNPNDKVTPLVTLRNDHRGLGKVRVSSGASYRELCGNGLYITKQMMCEFAFSHNGDIEEKVKMVKTSMIQFAKDNAKMARVFNMLAQTKVNETKVREFMAEYFPKTAQSQNKQALIMDYFHDADNGQIERDTAWNFWNARTRELTHNGSNRKPRNPNDTQQAAKLETLYQGHGAQESANFLESIIELTETRSMVEQIIMETEQKLVNVVTLEDVLAEMGV